MRIPQKHVEVGVLVLLLILLAGVLTHMQAIQDWVKMYGYHPSAAISKLATEDTMTSKGRHLFYLNRPELVANKTQFRKDCPEAEQTIVLGCYIPTEDGIYIYNVSDSRLNGITQVTAAHEMLHGAYNRLSSGQKKYVDGLLEDYYNHDLTDPRIKATIAAYKKTEPNSVVNEMHSVFGSEIANLPRPLENYYKQYFTNRQAVANFSSQYESVFTQNRQQLQSLKNQITLLRSELDSQKQTIDNQQSALTAQNQQLQSELDSGQTNSYNLQISAYNAQVSSLKAQISDYNSKVDEVNNLISKYNSLAYSQDSLYSSIDTRLQTHAAQ